MRVKPGTTHDLFEEWGVTGQTLGVRLDDNQGAVTVARVTGFVEFPAGSGVYELAGFTFPDAAGDYKLIFNDDGATYDPSHVSTRAVVVTSTAAEIELDGDTYADVDELFRILKIRTPSAEQTAAGERVLLAAAGEITSEIDLDEDTALSGWQVALAAQVNLERAAELWKLQEIQFGILELGGDFGATRIARNTWEKHAFTLAPLKDQFGLA